MEFKTIFRGGSSLLGLRVLAAVAVVLWVIALAFAYDTFSSFGLNPVDGYDGKLASLSHRIGLALSIAVFVSTVFFFLVFMAHHVVTRILVSEDHETLRIRTMGFWKWGQICIPRKHLLSATEEHHQAGSSTVTTPRLRIRIQDRKWSLWIQLPGNVLDPAAFEKFILQNRA